MRNQIFKNAKRLIKYLIQTGSTDRAEYFEFKFAEDSIPIKLVQEEKGTRIECTCKHCSLLPDYLCSYKIALILYKGGVR